MRHGRGSRGCAEALEWRDSVVSINAGGLGTVRSMRDAHEARTGRSWASRSRDRTWPRRQGRDGWRVAGPILAMALIITCCSTALPARACVPPPENANAPTAILKADVVVIGRVRRYERIAEPSARRDREARLARESDLSPEQRRRLRRATDYGRFTLAVDQVLMGRAPRTMTVFWRSNLMGGYPDSLPSGSYVIGLTQPDRNPVGGLAASHYTVAQGLCSGAKLFRGRSPEANQVRRLFGVPPVKVEMLRRSDPVSWPGIIMMAWLGLGTLWVGFLVWRWFFPGRASRSSERET